MSNKARADRTLAHFAILIIFSITVTIFLLYKANKVIADFKTMESSYPRVQ